MRPPVYILLPPVCYHLPSAWESICSIIQIVIKHNCPQYQTLWYMSHNETLSELWTTDHSYWNLVVKLVFCLLIIHLSIPYFTSMAIRTLGYNIQKALIKKSRKSTSTTLPFPSWYRLFPNEPCSGQQCSKKVDLKHEHKRKIDFFNPRRIFNMFI